jgi:hypothetical protein
VRRKCGPALGTTGHSLGGGLVAAGSTLSGVRGSVFNPAGVHPATLAEYGVTTRDGRDPVTSNHVPGEILSSAQRPLGRAVLSPLANVVKAQTATSGAVAMGRLPAVRETRPTVVPGPVGRQVTRPPVAAAEVPLFTAGVRHTGIFPTRAMEQQKDADRATLESALRRATTR